MKLVKQFLRCWLIALVLLLAVSSVGFYGGMAAEIIVKVWPAVLVWLQGFPGILVVMSACIAVGMTAVGIFKDSFRIGP